MAMLTPSWSCLRPELIIPPLRCAPPHPQELFIILSGTTYSSVRSAYADKQEAEGAEEAGGGGRLQH